MGGFDRNQHKYSLACESLEGRRLMTVDVPFINAENVLVIIGDWNHDDVQVSTGNTDLIFVEDLTTGEAWEFDLDDVDWIYFEGNDGDDTLVNLAAIPTEAHGGFGDDRLEGGDASDTLLGDAGRDVLLGFGGRDVLEGGSGHDSLYGGTGNDTLLGGSGNDYLEDTSGRNLFDGGSGRNTIVKRRR